MKANISFVIFIFILSSCATLDIAEIQNLNKITFDTLTLKPASEVNDFRFDIIRQTYEKQVNDSTKETKNTPYKTLGFDLGNGLFYDLNKNLCLRTDYLMGINPHKDYEFEIINRPIKNKNIKKYSFQNDTLSYSYPPKEKVYYNYHCYGTPDSMAYHYKRRFKYAIVRTDSSISYNSKRRKWDEIKKVNDTLYYINKRRWKREFTIHKNEIKLEREFIIQLSDDHKTLKILRQGARKNWEAYTLVKSTNKLFIYNKKYSGYIFEIKGETLNLYNNATYLRKFKILRK